MTNTTETMIFPLESENQFHENVKMAQIKEESALLSIESTASNDQLISTSSVLKKRKTNTAQVDSSQPTASLMDIISDPKLAYSSSKSRKIRKTEDADNETETPVAAAAGQKKLVLKDGKIEFEETAGTAVNVKVLSENTQKRITSASFKTTKNGEKWTEEETNRFYEGLEIFGSDFSMIGILFPKRTRDQIKKKFNREEKSDGQRVNEALKMNIRRRSIPEKLMETLKISNTSAVKTNQTGVVDEINVILCNIVKGN